MKYLLMAISLVFAVDAFSQSVEDSFVAEEFPAMEECPKVIIVENADDLTPEMSQTADTIIIRHAVPEIPVDYDFKKTPEWGKYKALRAVGWSMLGVSVPMFFGGLIVGILGSENNDDGVAVTGVIMICASPVLLLASIPILAVAYRNRYKAKHPRLEAGVTTLRTQTPTLAMRSMPAAGLTLTF